MSSRIFLPKEQIFSSLGVIGAGFKMNTYETGTTTPVATYSDTALSVANTNPVIADSSGRFGDVFVADNSLIKLVVTDADDVTIFEADPVDPKQFSISDFDPAPLGVIGGTLGTNVAYTLLPTTPISSYKNTLIFAIDLHLTNGDDATLNIYDPSNSLLGAKNIKFSNNTSNIKAGELKVGRHIISYDGTNMVVLTPSSNIGKIETIASTTVPSGHLECDGSAISRTTYVDLFNNIGTSWGVGDGSTTFNIPDLRGEFIRGWDNGKGTDSGRAFASGQLDELKSHNHTTIITRMDDSVYSGVQGIVDGDNTNGTGTYTSSNSGGNETRPRNFALMYIIKY